MVRGFALLADLEKIGAIFSAMFFKLFQRIDCAGRPAGCEDAGVIPALVLDRFPDRRDLWAIFWVGRPV